jgi:Domain of unknown function (DUF4410)
MQTVFQSIQRNASRLTLAAFAATSMLMAGCASATTMISDASVPATLAHVSADVIYVRGFDVNANQVRVDDNVMHRVKAMATGNAGALSQDQTALDARNAVADEIVSDLRAKGLHAERIDGPVPTDDEGKSRRRMLIGLGAGKSDVSASVQVFYQPAHGTPVPVELFQTSANSGHMPGIAETAGIGAAAGALTTAAATGAGVHGATEMMRDSISAEARRVGDAVAKQVAGVVEKLSKTV